jgi:opacity protein-like surface antigen
LRKVALFVSSFILLLVTLAHAQQIDIAAGGGTLLSSSPNSNLVNLQQPAEKNGTYINVSGDVVGAKRHLGLELETAWRYHKAGYPSNGETYRPILSDLNVLFQPTVARKIGLDLMGGIGIASTRFYGLNSNSCSNPVIGCVNYTSSNHFMEDLGAGIRYYVWRHVFVRPEVHYYHIQNNQEFHSGNVFRASVSIGLTLHH